MPKPLLKISNDQRRLCMTHPAQLDPCFEHAFDGVLYTVAYDAQSKRVTYIYTKDRSFRTADGLKMGDEIAVSEKTVNAIPYWEIFGPSGSDGWKPIIGFNGEVKLQDGSVLNLWGKKNGSSTGVATIEGFAKGPRRPQNS
ncbi:MAG: hypothetical protein ROO76_11445 [Terriglobia bacterium]|nr:hypothetical protein [Terriglobia bacterium]